MNVVTWRATYRFLFVLTHGICLTDEIFGQTYASAEENLLEAEIDLIEERKTAIFQVDSTWRHARTMVNVASGQLSSAIQIWKTITMNM